MFYSEQDKEEALTRRDLSQLTNMLNDGLDVNSLVVPKRTDILLAAINRENPHFFNTVLKNGFRCKNEHGFLYLHHAIRTHDIFYLKKLIEQYNMEGLFVDEKNTENENCLHVAAGESNTPNEIFECLDSLNISWADQNNYGQTPLHILIKTRFSISDKVVKILSKNKKAFKIEDNFGMTPIDMIQNEMSSEDWKNTNKELILLIKDC